MSKEVESLKVIDAEIKLTPDHRKKISQLLQDYPDRFLDARDCVSRALDVFLTWEKDPINSMTKMAEMEPTMKQFQFMKMALNPEKLKEMHPEFPGKVFPPRGFLIYCYGRFCPRKTRIPFSAFLKKANCFTSTRQVCL